MVEANRVRASCRLGAVACMALVSFMLMCLLPHSAEATSTWALHAANGTIVGKVVTIRHAGYGGPGAEIWYRRFLCAQIGHVWTELGMAKAYWGVYGPDGGEFLAGSGDPAGTIHRAGRNLYVSEDFRGTIWLRAIRGVRSGPWRIQVRSDGRWRLRGWAPRSCPGAFAAGAFVAYADLSAGRSLALSQLS
jgi:hypothetical protein